MSAWLCAWLATLAALAQGAAVRPRDPWVFRATLDQRPRAVVIALANEMWVAYDAATCGIYRCWSGGVAPRDEAFAVDGAVLTEAPTGSVWWIESQGKAELADAIFRGYRFKNNQVTLRYELRLKDGARIHVEETPEFERPDELAEDPTTVAPWMKRDLIGLRRSFKASGIPEGLRVSLTVRATCVGYVTFDRLLDPIDREVEGEGGVKLRELFARLPIDGDNATSEIHFFFAPPGGGAAK